MRVHMRTKKWAKPELSVCSYFISEPEKQRGSWRSLFEKDQPLFLELGCGKGVSTAKMVFDQQDKNFIAIDITSNVLGDARRNIQKTYGDLPITNVILTRYDLSLFREIFSAEDRIECIYINFCNPWTKRPKYAKRRLTHTRQLMQYRDVMAEGAEIWFKTDDDTLFNESIPCFEESGFEIVKLDTDLHASGFEPNYISEHEQMYMEKGVPIKFLIARMLPPSAEVMRRHDEVMEEISKYKKREPREV